MVCIFLLLTANPGLGEEKQKFSDMGTCRLESGKDIRDCRIGYRTFGRMNADKTNVVIFPTWFMGTAEQLGGFIGEGKMIDSGKYFVIAIDAIGNGVSSSPSTSAGQGGAFFPQFTIRDMVDIQHRFITKTFGLKRAHAVAGISMGGMQALEWMVAYPGFARKTISIVGTPCLTSYDLILWRAELLALECGKQDAAGGKSAMDLVAHIHSLVAYTPSHVAGTTSREAVPGYMKEMEKTLGKYSTDNWAAQLQAIMAHDIYRKFAGSPQETAKTVRTHALIIVSEEDHMVNTLPAMELAPLIKAETAILASKCGHFAFLCDREKIAAIVSRFLDK